MSSFCTAKATHIFSAKKNQHICVSLNANFNESLTNDDVSFEQLGPGKLLHPYAIRALFSYCCSPFFFLNSDTRSGKYNELHLECGEQAGTSEFPSNLA